MSRRKNDNNGLIDRYGLYIVLAVAIIARIAYLYQYHALPDWQQLTVDPNYHHHWAQDIASGDIFGDTTYFRAPLYAWCLGLLYAIVGDSLWGGRLFGVLIGLASVGMTYVFARRLFGPQAGLGTTPEAEVKSGARAKTDLGAKVGFVAGMIHAVFYMALYFEPELLVDPLYTLLLLVAMDRFVVWYRSMSAKDALWFAVWLGVASITRPNALVMLPVVLAMLLVRWREMSTAVAQEAIGHGATGQTSDDVPMMAGIRPMVKQAGMVILGLVITIGPVTVRNIIMAGDATMIASSGGINLYIGNNPEADGVSAVLPPPLGPNWRIESTVMLAEKDLGRELTPGEVSSYWSGKAIDWMMENPGRFVSLYGEKLSLFFANTLISNNRELYQFIERVPLLDLNPVRFAPVLGLAVIGLLAGAWRSRPLRWLVVFVVLSILSGALFFYATRFSLPLWPVFFVLAGYGVVRVAGVWRESTNRGIGVVAAGVVVAVVSYLIAPPEAEGVSTHALIEAGTYHYSTGDYELAGRFFRQAAQIDPTWPGINTNLGTVLLQKQQIDSGMAYLKKETEVNPWYANAWTNLAYAHLMRGNPQAALPYAQAAVEREPYAYGPNMAVIEALQADSTVSQMLFLAEAKAAAKRTGNDVFLLTAIGDYLLNREQASAAGEFFRMALEAEPPAIEMDHEAFRHKHRNSRENVDNQRAMAAIQLSYIEGMAGRVGPAIEYSLRAVELAPGLPEAYLNLYGGYKATGRLVAADSVLQEAAERFPGDANVRELMRGR